MKGVLEMKTKKFTREEVEEVVPPNSGSTPADRRNRRQTDPNNIGAEQAEDRLAQRDSVPDGKKKARGS